MGGISALQLSDGAEGVEQFSGFGRAGMARERRPQFLDGKGVEAGVLAGIERVQVKAERAHLPQQGIDVGLWQAFSPVGAETVLHQQEIVLKLASVVVGSGSADGLAALLKPVKHVGEKAAITFCRVV